MIVLVTGGSGCGKSAFAEGLLARLSDKNRVYVATLEVYDDESRRRVARHRAMRADKGFVTVECPRDLNAKDIPEGASVLLEDLPNLVAGEMFGGDIARLTPALDRLMARCRHLVVVSADVFSDGVTYDEATENYRRCLAEQARRVAERADVVVEVVYSIPIWLKGAPLCDC